MSSDQLSHHFLFFLKPVQQWSVNNVIEWMAAVNLYRYAEVFKMHDIKGQDLQALDEDKLMVSLDPSSVHTAQD